MPQYHFDMFAAGIAGAQLSVVAGAGHALIWTHPEPLVQRAEGFLGP